jgi:hypothetical protein
MSRGLPFLNICDYDTQANTSEKHSPNKYELIHSKRYPEAIPKIIAEKWDPKNTSLYTKEESPPDGGRLFEVLSHRLWEVFFPGAITYFQLSQRMIFFAHIDTPIFNGDHSPKFTQQVSLEYQRWLAECFIIA